MVQDKTGRFFEMPESRQKAIRVMEMIAEMLGNETMFDCHENNDTQWYDFEDAITTIIEEK